ncbi:YceI family protein [Formosa agariphila KMM 3901]|uniref:YceI family protein n=1 Tax=Formosa agariphila (strain DSM 15362 / KCTC 12365 / LMG 23005 / KMM 3901 / M-2Alg 35-1) TaxID=1347342 RepID=T2KJB3_FORAG|nr:YceI family protein [Formosa agariphila]CDF78855.1 YceI family protein [Formosa agariphila KMM 3901]
MKTENHPLKISQSLIILVTFLGSLTAFAQTYSLNNDSSKLSVLGTSSIHDWEVTAEQQSGSIVLENANETLSISALDIKVIAESLKSGKSGMDKNTYKALNTKKFNSIDFKLTKVNSITPNGSGVYKVKSTGDLSIAGTTNPIQLDFTLTLTDNSAKLTGSYTFKMTQFKIDPPTAMFGTITTGDELKIEFNTVLQ